MFIRTIILLLGIVISFKGFANPSAGTLSFEEFIQILVKFDTHFQSDFSKFKRENLPSNRTDLPIDTGFIESQWVYHLHNQSNWQERQDAVKNWKAIAQFTPKAVVFHLQSMLSDRSKKVREAVVTALK